MSNCSRQCNDGVNKSIARKGPGARAHKPASVGAAARPPKKGVSNRGK